jgi:hypothetical protein
MEKKNPDFESWSEEIVKRKIKLQCTEQIETIKANIIGNYHLFF